MLYYTNAFVKIEHFLVKGHGGRQAGCLGWLIIRKIRRDCVGIAKKIKTGKKKM